MKIFYKAAWLGAIVSLFINIFFIVSFLSKKSEESIKYKQYSTDDDYDKIMQRINSLTPPPDIEKLREICELRRNLVEIDSTSLPDLYSYATSLMQLARNERDLIKQKTIADKIQQVAETIKTVRPQESQALLYAAFVYAHSAFLKPSYSDSADAIYNRILFLIEVDSIEIPEKVINDVESWLSELREVVNDARTINRTINHSNNRKFIFIY